MCYLLLDVCGCGLVLIYIRKYKKKYIYRERVKI